MVIETFLNIFLCYSSLQCNRIPYFSPKHYIESTLVGNNRQYAFKRCNDTAILPKVYLNDVCRCVPEKFYSNFMFIKDGIRRGQFNGFKMNCTQVFNSTAEMSGGTVPQTAAPSRISTALADLLRRRGVSPLEIARIQATGLSEAELEQLQARRKLTLTEAAYMRSRGVPIQQINAFQIRGLLPSEIRALRVSGRLPPALPSRPFRRVLSSPVSGNLPQVTPIRPVRGVIANRIGRPLLPPVIPGRLPVVTPLRPVTIRNVPNAPPTANRRITKFQELQLLSRQANPLQLIQSVRSLNIADLLSVSREMTADQFVAMWKILTDAQKQQLRPQLTAQMRDRLTSTQTSQESLQAFQNLLTPRQMMQLSPEQLRRLGAVLAAMDGDKSQLPDGLLPTSNGDKTTETGLPFRQPDTTAVIGTSPGSTGITVVGSDSSNAAEIGTIDITGDNSIGGEGSAPATGTGMLTPVNKDSGAEKMILYDVVATEPGDSQLNKGNIVEVGISPIDTSGNVVDTGNQNVPDPPSPDLQLTSGSLVIDNTVVNAPPPSSGGAITGTSGSSSTNTVTTIETENTVIKSTSTNTQSQTDVIIPNYNIIQDTEDLQQDICKVCEARDRTVACYLEHPKMCNKFIQCVTDYGEKLRPQVMKCYPFMFWNPTFNSCVRNSTHCKTSTGLEDLPREPTVEAPVVYDNNPAEVVIETTAQPSTEATTESPPDYAPFERVHATVEMSLLPAPPSESGLTFPDAAPSGLDFPDIHTARRGFILHGDVGVADDAEDTYNEIPEKVQGPKIITSADIPFNMDIPTSTASPTPGVVKTSPTPVPVEAPPSEACEMGWIRFQRDCYYFSSDKRTWRSALTQCHNMGGHLARIYTTEENRFVENTARNRNDGGPYDGYWLGGSDLRNEGVWEWHETQKEIGPVFWHQSEPNSFQGEQDCLQLFVHHGFQWDDEVCTFLRHYVCEKSAKLD